ncbi:esterase-like activity of phytase family protein [Micromonospora sp. B9E7]|uniref:esterase-like activity of phytase family protein n=1 Tax=Micromonospora sp. B9E7 TaxID=3153574 RepID=UPI00325C62F7
MSARVGWRSAHRVQQLGNPALATLYPLLEGTVAGDPTGKLRINEFDVRTSTYTGRRWTYALDAADHAIGDAIMVGPRARS